MLHTARLILHPLTYAQLCRYARCDGSLEAELGLRVRLRSLSSELREALENTILPHVADPSKDYLFCTLWTGIRKEDRTMVGEICIVDEPNAAGEIEIGYGTDPEFQGQGYMTEMVSGLIAWARTQPQVKRIIATTNKTNTASGKVLQKNHFHPVAEGDTEIRWKLVMG